MKKAIVPVLLLVVFVVCFVGSPYYKLYVLKGAYDKGDYQPIVQSIDFQQLRPNLKHQLYPKIEQMINNNQATAVLQVLGIKNATLKNAGIRLVDGAIDGAITADNLDKLARGEISKDSELLLAGVALMGGFIDVDKLLQDYLQTGDVNVAIRQQKTAIAKQFAARATVSAKPKLSYCGINCFYVQTDIKGYPVQVLLSRHGVFDWKIDDVLLLQERQS